MKIQFAGQVCLGDLTDYLNGKGNGKVPQDAIQALDIIMRQMPSLHFMPVGRSFFPLDGFSCPLGEGWEVRFGFYSSVRHSEWKVPLLNIDGKLNAVKVRHALPWPPNKLFLQVSQSGYANLINGLASLQSTTGK